MDHLPPKDAMCHCAWFEKSCRDLVTSGACRRWTNIRGMNPQTGEDMDRWDCIDNHTPVLLMSIGKATNEAGAATESVRNQIMAVRARQAERHAHALDIVEARALPGAAE